MFVVIGFDGQKEKGMTRKRFIKLVMARGHDRNFANYFAHRAMDLANSYQEFWDLFTRPNL